MVARAKLARPFGLRPLRIMDLTGHKYGHLAVLRFAGKGRMPCGQSYSNWECLCDCGKILTVRIGPLRSRPQISCGCVGIKKTVARNTRHGMANKVPEYVVWKHMKSRCYNPKNKDFKNYGGRGISVCDRWRSNFGSFLGDMGKRPTSLHTIERINVNGNYEPGNCCWLEAHLQSANRRCVKRAA